MALNLTTWGIGHYAPNAYDLATDGLAWRNRFIGEIIEMLSLMTIEMLYDSPITVELLYENIVEQLVEQTVRLNAPLITEINFDSPVKEFLLFNSPIIEEIIMGSEVEEDIVQTIILNSPIYEELEFESKIIDLEFNSPICKKIELESPVAEEIFLTARANLF